MHVHFIAPARYVRASHDIIRHPRLRATAKSLLLWMLSLPPGSRETILSIGKRMPEGRMAISRARSQLIDEGYLHVRKYQNAQGTWNTELMVSSVPLTEPEEIAAAWAAAEPTAQNPTVGAPSTPQARTSPKGEKTEENTSLPATPPAAPDPRPEDAEAARLLHSLGARDHRLRLGLMEAFALAPLAREWLARDADPHRFRDALAAGLPDRVYAPAAFLRDRLERKMPTHPAPVPPPRAGAECGRCKAPIPSPGICRACAGLTPPTAAPEPDVADRNRRGAARVRALLQGARLSPLPGC